MGRVGILSVGFRGWEGEGLPVQLLVTGKGHVEAADAYAVQQGMWFAAQHGQEQAPKPCGPHPQVQPSQLPQHFHQNHSVKPTVNPHRRRSIHVDGRPLMVKMETSERLVQTTSMNVSWKYSMTNCGFLTTPRSVETTVTTPATLIRPAAAGGC